MTAWMQAISYAMVTNLSSAQPFRWTYTDEQGIAK